MVILKEGFSEVGTQDATQAALDKATDMIARLTGQTLTYKQLQLASGYARTEFRGVECGEHGPEFQYIRSINDEALAALFTEANGAHVYKMAANLTMRQLYYKTWADDFETPEAYLKEKISLHANAVLMETRSDALRAAERIGIDISDTLEPMKLSPVRKLEL